MATTGLSVAGVYREDKDREAFSLGGQATVFQAEVSPCFKLATRKTCAFAQIAKKV